MHPLRTLRRSRDLTLLDLAQLTGIPARLLAEAEYGLRALSGYEQSQLAFVFGLDETTFTRHSPASLPVSGPLGRSLKQTLVAAALATALATSALRARETLSDLRAFRTAPAAPQAAIALVLPSATPAASATATASPTKSATPSATATASPTASPTITPSPSATPSPSPTPAFFWSQAGPVGCPLDAPGRVVITQGYGVGTHAPAETMGGIDLAIDGNGDGLANGDATLGAVVRATHGGVVRLDADTWPAGNHVWVSDEGRGWRTGYAHLGAFLVANGQQVAAGDPIGVIGLTGMTTGPHLHYHVWWGGVNIDPTDLVDCS